MEVGRPPKLIQACCCIARSETLVTYGYVVSFGHMFWMCVVDVCFGRAVRKMIFARPRRPQEGLKTAPRCPYMAPPRGQDGPRWPQDGPKMAQDGPWEVPRIGWEKMRGEVELSRGRSGKNG